MLIQNNNLQIPSNATKFKLIPHFIIIQRIYVLLTSIYNYILESDSINAWRKEYSVLNHNYEEKSEQDRQNSTFTLE